MQRWLESLPYNREEHGETLHTFRGVVRANKVHCLEGALCAATILEQHGFPPILADMESQDDLDHVVLLFRRGSKYGTVARSRDPGLHGRKPVFRSVRDLVLTYVEPYVDFTGRLTGYGVGTLSDLGDYDWRFSPKNVWKVEEYLLKMPHKKYHMSKRRYVQVLRRYKAFRAADSDAPVNYYDSRPTWMGNPNSPSPPIPKKLFREIRGKISFLKS